MDQRKSAVLERIDSTAWVIATSPTLQAAAAVLRIDVSTLRVWRQQPDLRERVGWVREQLDDERLARYRASEQEVEEVLLSIIRNRKASTTARVAAIREYHEQLSLAKDRASKADASADYEEWKAQQDGQQAGSDFQVFTRGGKSA